MAILLEWFVGNCVKHLVLKSLKIGIYTIFKLSEKVNHKLIWDMNIQCDNIIVERRQDIAIVNKMEKTAIITDNYR